MKNEKPYRGFYINLKSSIDRRIFIEHQLRTNNVLDIYSRFDAIKNNNSHINSTLTNSELGCLRSHISILENNQDSDKHIHIIEDDIKFCASHHIVLERFMEINDDWDIAFTGLQIPLIRKQVNALINIYENNLHNGGVSIKFFDMSNFLFVGAFSYIINKKSIHKFLDIYKNQNFNEPIDFIFRKEICITKRIQARCVFPLMAMHSGELDTTMSDRAYELTYKYQYLFQKPFIADININKVFEEIKDYALSIGFEIQSQTPSISNIYDELFNLGQYIISSPNIHGKYRQ